jgi:hypothetical protein
LCLKELPSKPGSGSSIPQAQKISNYSISSTESDNLVKIIEEVISDNDLDNGTYKTSWEFNENGVFGLHLVH